MSGVAQAPTRVEQLFSSPQFHTIPALHRKEREKTNFVTMVDTGSMVHEAQCYRFMASPQRQVQSRPSILHAAIQTY